jgi:hypothetical protein
LLVFLRQYRSVLGAFALLYLLGNAFAPAALLLLAVIMVRWMQQGRDDYLIIMLLIILIMGDSRAYYFDYVKNLRIVAIMILGVRTFVQIGQGKYAFRSLLYLSIPFFVVAFLGGLRSPTIGTSLSKLVSYFLLLVVTMHYLPYQIKRQPRVLADMATLGIVILILGFVLIPVNRDLVYLIVRYRGMLGNPNGLGIYCCMVFPLLLMAQELFPEHKRRWQLGIFMVILSILYANSRTALGTLGLFYFLHWFYKRNAVATVSLWVLILPGLALFFSFVSPSDLIRMAGLGEELRVESLETGTGRFLAWALGWEQILQNPFIGRGFDYEGIYFHSLAELLVTTEHQGGMHNSWLTFMMNNGLIGFLFFLLFVLPLLFRMRARAYGLPFALSMIVSATFESWLTSSLNAFSIHFYLIVMLLVDWPDIQARVTKRLDQSGPQLSSQSSAP